MTSTPFGKKTPFGLLVAVALTAGLAACASDDKMAASSAPAPAPAVSAPAPAPAKPMGKMTHKQHVEALQTALNGKGAALTVDGKMGPKTSAALKAFQKSGGMKPTGRPDPKTMAALGL
jgi:peptidoglycan hydrolase-like protein with peptidoglycan-binding domain